MDKQPTIIPLEDAPTLAAAFRERVKRSPNAVAYIQYVDDEWRSYTWQQTAHEVARWQQAFLTLDLAKGTRIAIMCGNRREWAICDQAAIGLGLVTVPFYTNDRAENLDWILEDSQAEALIIEGQQQWDIVNEVALADNALKKIIGIDAIRAFSPKFIQLEQWLPEGEFDIISDECAPEELVSIVYTSGTTGRSKGVMLSHHNMLWDLHAGLKMVNVYADDLFLSFLPLSHTLERTVGYYLPIVSGSTVAYNRSLEQLADDLLAVKPTILISVPRIFERVYGKISAKLDTESTLKKKLFHSAIDIGWRKYHAEQKTGGSTWDFLFQPLLDKIVGAKVRAKLGGRLRFAICGGAALSENVAKMFIGLGIPVLQGYGLTETSPIISVNPLQRNIPKSVGLPLPGIEIKVTDEGELAVRSPAVMMGYWHNEKASAEMIDTDGWLYTGDKVALDAQGYISITGRLKEIIVMSNGEKVPPVELENAIALDGLIEQVMVIGEAKPYLSGLVVLNEENHQKVAEQLHIPMEDTDNQALTNLLLEHVSNHLKAFPGYAVVRRLKVIKEAWTPDNGLITPTLKIRRKRILEHYKKEVAALYKGHQLGA